MIYKNNKKKGGIKLKKKEISKIITASLTSSMVLAPCVETASIVNAQELKNDSKKLLKNII